MLAVLLPLLQVTAEAPVTLADLTVPEDRLPPACALSPSPSQSLGGNVVQAGLWAGLPIKVNPWMGADTQLIVTIRERIDGPAPQPDGPPPSLGQLARFRLHLADDVEEAYAAIYAASGPPLVVVYAVRFAGDADAATPSGDAIATKPGRLRLTLGNVVVVVSGHDGPCFDAVATHVRALGER